MRAWCFMLGGLIVWAVHFLGVYGIASIADVASRADANASLWTVAGFTLLCAAADLVLLVAAWRRRRAGDGDLTRFQNSLATLGAAFSLIAVVWQGLPALVGH